VSQVGDIARQLPGADHQKAPGGAKWGAQGMPVELQHSLTPRGLQDDRAAGHVQPAQQPLVCGTARQQLVDPAGIAQWLLQQAQGATAGQAETRGFFLAHAIGDQLAGRRWLIAHDPGEQVVLDAATGHRALDTAVAAQRQQRAHRARRAAPGFDHRVEHHRVTVTQPVAGTPQHCQIDTVHRSPRIHCLHRLAGMQAVTDGLRG